MKIATYSTVLTSVINKLTVVDEIFSIWWMILIVVEVDISIIVKGVISVNAKHF